MSRPDLKPEHDLFIQHLKLSNTLRILVGEEVLDHSGLDYYEGAERNLSTGRARGLGDENIVTAAHPDPARSARSSTSTWTPSTRPSSSATTRR